MRTNDPTQRRKKRIAAVNFTIAALVFLLALTIGLSALTSKKQGRPPIVFGYSFLLVQSDSMVPVFGVGDLIVVKVGSIQEADVGDDVVYTVRSGALVGRQIVHRVIRTGEDTEGRYLTTQGVKEGAPVDSDAVREDNYFGIAVGRSAGWGRVFTFLTRAENWLLIGILAGLIAFMIRQTRKIVGYLKRGENSGSEQIE